VSRDRCGKPKIKMPSNTVKVSGSHDRSHTLIWNEILQCTVTAQKPIIYINFIQSTYSMALLFIYLF